MTISISRAVASALLLLSLSPPLHAYRLPWNSVNSGGQPGSLSGYLLNGSVGQTVQGKGATTTYLGSWGFWPGVWGFSNGTIDFGVTSILEPSGVIDTLMETPRSMVHNFGTATRDITTWFEIRDSTHTVVYLQSAVARALAGGDEVAVPFPNWDVPNDKDGCYYAGSWTVIDGDMDPANDTTRSQFAVEARQQGPPSWVAWPDAPAGPQDRDIGPGAALTTDAGGFCAYLLKGNNTCEFYRFDPATAFWYALDPIPEQGRGGQKRTVKDGGTLAQVNGKFYATKGGNSLEFWEYDPAAQPAYRWSQKADVPAGGAGVHIGASATGVRAGIASYVYLLKASGTFEFYRYDAARDSWKEMASAPGQPDEEFKIGSSVSYDGTDTIFALKGILNKFYAYVVSTNTWLERPDLPLGPDHKQAKGGASICYHLRKVYCIKGSNSQEFWVFDCTGNTWYQGPDVTLGEHKNRVRDGGALVYCRASRYLFATKGGCLEFWSYGMLSNYGGVMADEVVAIPGYGVNAYGLATPGRDRVAFALPRAGNVSLKLYDMTGRVVRVLVNGWQQAGRHEVSLRAASLAQGAYVLRYAAGDYLESRKLIVQR